MARPKSRKPTHRPKVQTKLTDMAPSKGESPFPFLELPPEVRKQIYKYLLVENKNVALRTWKRHNGKAELVRRDHHRIRWRRGQVREGRFGRWIAAPPALNSIMFVNKQIYQEASQVLYGENEFEFETTTALKDFLAAAGPRAQHLRYVSLLNGGLSSRRGYMITNARAAFKALAIARSLRKLRFDHTFICTSQPYYYGCTRVDVSRIAGDCKDLLIALKASYAAANLAGEVLDILDFMAPTCFACSDHHLFRGTRDDHLYNINNGTRWGTLCGCTCGDQDEISEKAQQLFKKITEKALARNG